MTIEEMENDERIMAVNDDVVAFVKLKCRKCIEAGAFISKCESNPYKGLCEKNTKAG